MAFSALLLLKDRFVASDPGYARLLSATRVTLAVALSVIVLAIIEPSESATATILGALVAMQGLLAVNDPEPKITTLLAPLPGTLGIVLGAVFAERGWIADVVFLCVLFCAVAVRARGPRWTAFGTIAMITYFVALFLGATVAELPALIAAVIVASSFAYLVRFVLVADRSRWIAERMVSAFEARVRNVAVAATALLEARDPAGPRRRLAHATAQLNETAAAIEGRLGDSAADEIRIIFDAELAAEDLAGAAAALRDAAVPVPRALRLALTALTRNRVARAGRVAASALELHHNHPAADAVAAAIVDLSATIGRIEAAAPTLAQSATPWSGPGVQQPALRQAIQVTIASAVAIAIGEAISPQRWYWAVLATYFVFVGTASSGETFARAWSRIAGTALGVAAGILAELIVHGHPLADVAAIFTCLFFSVYFLRISYMLMIFFITMLLALLYTLLGRFSDGVLGLRLAETAIGAICGGVAATFILPTRTRDVVRASANAALAATKNAIHASILQLVDPSARNAPLDAARIVEERVQEFVARARPATAAPTLIGTGHELRRWITSLSACSYYARMLARTADRVTAPVPTSTATQLMALDAVIADNIRAAGERVDGNSHSTTTATLALFEALRSSEPPLEHAGTTNGNGDVSSAAHLLERLDRTIARLARDEGTITEIV